MKKAGSIDQSNSISRFWVFAGLLGILLASILARDITRPFYGLHSWAEAHAAWSSRVHLKYGFGYTKGLRTWAVGDPPVENPPQYLDHPQLSSLLNTPVMAVLGINEWSFRVLKIILAVVSLLLFLRILRGLVDEQTALLAGLLYVLFPLSGYFGLGGWLTPVVFLAMWYYLVLIESLKDGPKPTRRHKWGLAVSLFLIIQLSWAGFFYAFVIGSHYVFRCIFRRQLPQKTILAILLIAPLSSLVVVFGIMASGYNWDFQKILALYEWRASKGEMAVFEWGEWIKTFWKFAVTNYTLPILITAILYITFGQLLVFASQSSTKDSPQPSRRFPQLWLFLMPGTLLLLVLKGLVWKHQYWQQPLSAFVAIAAASGVMLLADALKKIHPRVAVAAVVAILALFFGFCAVGTNYYYSIRWQPLARINMFKDLNQKIPPDKKLLSYEMRSYFVNQHKSKGGHYRPEIAWYLDRDIEQATTLKEIEAKARTGRFSYYLIPNQRNYLALINKLRQKYQVQLVRGQAGEATKKGKFIKAGVGDQWLFDLSSKAPSR